MRRWMLVAVLMGLAAQAQAAEVYRCVAPDGAVSYRDTSCPVGYVHARTYRSVDNPAGDAQRAKRDAQYLDMGRSWLTMQDATASTGARDDKRVRCNAAKGNATGSCAPWDWSGISSCCGIWMRRCMTLARGFGPIVQVDQRPMGKYKLLAPEVDSRKP